jgi:two-component system sensor histidine kinase DesK
VSIDVDDPSERALSRMRRYTSFSLVVVMAAFVVLTATQAQSLGFGLTSFAVGALASAYLSQWERRPPVWFTVVTIGTAAALWTATVLLRESPIFALVLLTAAMVPISQLRKHRVAHIALAFALSLIPVGIAWLARPDEAWQPYVFAAAICTAAGAALLFLNRYAWNLYLELDSARTLSADLAVAQERYRFAADLHDIQGHTLHVLRLKTQLAARLIERDPQAAAEHLREADALIAETLANTRSLAFGERHVALASELANARGLLEAAGIDVTITGTSAGVAQDELFGLVVREATTNMLRHAQPSRVTVTIDPDRIVVTNDGSPSTSRPPSGLARLAERFAAIGGSLRTSIDGEVFTTEALAR